MQGDDHSIGELARTAGVTVKAVRFYTDRGILPSRRTASGHRRYGPDAVARLALVRTLRDLGLDLATIRKIVDRETSPAEAAAAHADAVAVQMRMLRIRHAVLTTAARRDSTPRELELMHRLARLSTAERDDLVNDFLDNAFGAPDGPLPGVLRRSLTPELPDDPTSEQLAAWVELAEMAQDEPFRALMRSLFNDHMTGGAPTPPRKHAVGLIREIAPPLLGTPPDSPEASAAVTTVVTAYAESQNLPDTPSLRARLAAYLTAANDPRRERYLTLLATVNGWLPPDHPRRELTWFLTALAANSPDS
ncbi:MerR family transcriptional regulator [Actinomadura rupiterrae]|uniref:MerR family transcriptional regulator n=1 Tax=Actinomadura rupiterrae TaxID=559627 RepID=UPI0020A317AB|nr:MerR family transcriptional regulator [Actinomadura rupiterrae]MCP2336922.1 DNA-binding transcriptional MerR regulator [Actinomadura rupiterrae]